MYSVKNEEIEINGKAHRFDYPIRKVDEKDGYYYVLIGVPASLQNRVFNNIYCLDCEANLVWQSQNLDEVSYPPNVDIKPEAYVGMVLKESYIKGVTFFAHTYYIDYATGKTKFAYVGRW